MQSLNSLQRQAAKSTHWRGHSMQWRTFDDVRIGKCRKCGKHVLLLVSPRPNEINIGGEAVALNCTK